MDRTVTPNGRRCSAAVAYLKPSLGRSNFTFKSDAMVNRLQVQGNRATGLEYEHRGQVHQVEVEKEIILSGGSINSPQLLMLSGIGPADHLREHGIDVSIDLPGVGQNLHDHPLISLKYVCTKPVTPHNLTNPIVKLWTGAQWMFTGTGLAASNMYEAGGLVRSDPDIDYPNIEFQFCPVGVTFTDKGMELDQGFILHQDLLRPTSRGELTLASANPRDKVRLQFNYLSTEEDMRNTVNGLRLDLSSARRPSLRSPCLRLKMKFRLEGGSLWFAQNEIGRAGCDHLRRGVGISACNPWHDRCVDHAESLYAVNTHLTVDNRHLVIAHTAGAYRMEVCFTG